jgi:hypothetical protein
VLFTGGIHKPGFPAAPLPHVCDVRGTAALPLTRQVGLYMRFLKSSMIIESHFGYFDVVTLRVFLHKINKRQIF